MDIIYKILTEDEAKNLGLFDQLNTLEAKLDKDQEKYMEFNNLPDTFIYSCAFDNNKLIGSVMSSQNKQDDSIKKDRPLVRFNEVFVDPKYRRMGIATNLIINLMNWWKDKDSKVKFSLGVFAGNKTAIRIYEKLGFKPYLYKMINKNFSIIKNFSTPTLYHLSSEKLINLHFYPRVVGYGKLMEMEDIDIPRISCSDSILNCLRGMPDGIHLYKDLNRSIGSEFYVYSLINPIKKYIRKPTIKQVPDVDYTKELWYLKDCYLKYIGKIRITKIWELKTKHSFGFTEHDLVYDRDCEYEWKEN